VNDPLIVAMTQEVQQRSAKYLQFVHCSKLILMIQRPNPVQDRTVHTCVPAAPRGLKSLSPSSLATCSTSRYVLNSACAARWRGLTRSWLARKMPAAAGY
jgi:hypothetical protein